MSKSPIKSNPLNNPGESLELYIREYIDDKVIPHLIGSTFIVCLTIAEWVRWYFETPPNPLLLSFMSLIVVAYSVLSILKQKRIVTRLRLGLKGEKAVGQHLESMREHGAKVFHDIQGDGFNLDHVIVHSSGIYVLETKTYSKPEESKPVIRFDGNTLSFPGGYQKDAPIIQVKAASAWIQELISESTGKKFSVKPVVLFPGWFIENIAAAQDSNVWVLNPKAFPSYLRNAQSQLSTETVNMIAYHLSRHIRSTESGRWGA